MNPDGREDRSTGATARRSRSQIGTIERSFPSTPKSRVVTIVRTCAANGDDARVRGAMGKGPTMSERVMPLAATARSAAVPAGGGAAAVTEAVPACDVPPKPRPDAANRQPSPARANADPSGDRIVGIDAPIRPRRASEGLAPQPSAPEGRSRPFATPSFDPASAPNRSPGPSAAAERRHRRRRARSRFGLVTFVLLWLIPTALVAFYYAVLATDQYVVESQFAVRGVETSPLNNLSTLGLAALPGGNEASDSYVVADYIESAQIIEDIRRFEGVDVRQFFARPLIDFVHRIDPATPIAEFADTWRWRTNVEYNSITGNTTFEVYAFTPEDARRIAQLVLSQSERVVNELSREAREALISTAQSEVERTQQRLREASADVLAFRNAQQIVDPTQAATLEAGILQELESSLAELRTRRRALVSQVSASSPAVRALDPQIAALEAQINEQRQNIGAGSGEANAGNVAAVLGEFTDLSLSEEFARTAYTAALQSLETAQADARKRERYLAVFVAPGAPDVSLHPKRLLYTLVAAFWFLILWGVVVFVTRSVRDHAI